MSEEIERGVARIEARADVEEQREAPAPNVAPQGDLILLRRVRQERSGGGIVLPETAQDKMMSLVVEVGPGRITESGYHVQPRFKAGQYVLVAGHASGYVVDRDHVMVHDKDVVGVWREGSR